MVGDVKQKRAASKAKKSRRKYRKLAEGVEGARGEGEEGEEEGVVIEEEEKGEIETRMEEKEGGVVQHERVQAQ